MRARLTSPEIVGRSDELSYLGSALGRARDHEAGLVVLGGEAGVGKTRLVEELAATARSAGVLAISGGCIALRDRPLPFAPVLESLRELARVLDSRTLATVLGSGRAAVALLVPELADTDRSPQDTIATASLFEHLLGVLTRAGEQATTMLVLEDLHWADEATLDLIGFLARNLRTERVLVLATYRTDELHRRHPLRPVLAELERNPRVGRLDVGRLDREAIAVLAENVLGRVPESALIEQVYERSEGNAFFAEELLAFAGEGGYSRTLPPSIRETLLARLDLVSDEGVEVLRLTSVSGDSIPHAVLEALVPDPTRLDGALRELTASHLLVATTENTFRFRHALMSEAVYDDLLPGERIRTHRRIAELIEARPEVLGARAREAVGELACHWQCTGDADKALGASLDAAKLSRHMHAFADELRNLERALELWETVGVPLRPTEAERRTLVLRASTAASLAGRDDRARKFLADELASLDIDAHPRYAGLVLSDYARVRWRAGDKDVLDDARRAVELVPDDEVSVERAQVVGALAQLLMLRGCHEEATGPAQETIALAQELNDPALESHARNTLGTALGAMGWVDRGLHELDEAERLAREVDRIEDVARAAVNRAPVLCFAGRFEEAVSTSLAAAEEAARVGLERSHSTFLRLNAIESLLSLGRWEEASAELARVRSLGTVGTEELRRRAFEALMAVGRGDLDSAEALLAPMRGDGIPDIESHAMQAELELAAARRDFNRVRQVLDAVLRDGYLDPHGCDEFLEVLVWVGLDAAVDASDDARGAGDERKRTAVAASAAAWHDVLTRESAAYQARNDGGRDFGVHLFGMLSGCDAAMARIDGVADAVAATAAVDSFRGAGLPLRLGRALMRRAQLRLEAGDTSGAADDLGEAHRLATTVGARALEHRVDALARRARINLLSEAAQREADDVIAPFGLTAREVQVVALIASGATNRQIGEQLFIAEKTASVHVSNILGKLGVANRTEAGAVAREHGLD